MNSTELRQERAKVFADMTGLDKRASEEKRDLTSEESEQWDRLDTRYDELSADLAKAEKHEQRAREQATEAPAIVPAGGAPAGDDERNDDPNAELRAYLKGESRGNGVDEKGNRVFVLNFTDDDVHAVRSGRGGREHRDLSVGSAAAGGNTVPISFVRRLYEHLIETSVIRQTNVSTLTTASGEELRLPKTTAHGAKAAIVAEGGAFLENDPTFGQVVLNAYKYGKLLQLTSELVEDTAVDLIGYVSRDMGRAIALGTDEHYIVGDGASKPNGLVTASSLGVTAAGTAAITTDELMDLFYSVIRPYRQNGSWMLKDSTVKLVRKLKDADEQYIWAPGLIAGEPDRLLGRPVFVEPNMPAATTGLKSVLFGDLSTYTIRDVGSVELKRSDEFAFANDLITYRVRFRTDGDLIDTTGAVKHLIQA